jgi:hypothetical protein
MGRSSPSMAYIFSPTIGSKQALVLISIMVVITAVDSQFIHLFYGTKFGTPGNLHVLLFGFFIIVVSIINVKLLLFAKRNDEHAKTSRPLLFRFAYIITSTVQYAILLVLLVSISEMLIFHGYNKVLSLLVTYSSHFCAAGILGVLSITFIQWFRTTRSFSILIYGVVFIMIIFLLLLTVPLLTEQFVSRQPNLIIPTNYITLIDRAPTPSSDIAFLYGLGNYGLPLMIISSWILTVSILKPYIRRIGKKKFWAIVSIPLLYQLFTFIVRDANLVSDPALVDIIYSRPLIVRHHKKLY